MSSSSANALPPGVSTPTASPKQLLYAVLTAVGVATLLVLGAVLPVEYGLDPLGVGRSLGLLRTPPTEESPMAPPSLDAGLVPVKQGEALLYASDFRTDDVQFVLQPYDYVEYKYHLVEGAQFLFSWRADEPLTQEFHGEPDANPEAVRSYDKGTRQGANGMLTAPMTGIHGWFFENPGNQPITIHLTSAGFYPYAMEFRSDKTRHRHEVKSALPGSDASQETAK